MQAVRRLILFTAFFCMLTAARAADLTGTWKGSFDFEGTTVSLSFHLKADGTALTGNIEGLPTTPADIHDGKIDGSTLTFWTNTDYEGQTYKLVFSGKVNGDQIDFSLGTDDGSWGTTLSVKQEGAAAAAPAAPAAPDISGAWAGSFDFNGNSMPVTITLHSSGAAVTGNVTGMGAAPIEIHDGKIEGDTVTFSINVDYQGQTYEIRYTGKIAAGQIEFNFGTADGSWGSSLTAKKSSTPAASATPK